MWIATPYFKDLINWKILSRSHKNGSQFNLISSMSMKLVGEPDKMEKVYTDWSFNYLSKIFPNCAMTNAIQPLRIISFSGKHFRLTSHLLSPTIMRSVIHFVHKLILYILHITATRVISKVSRFILYFRYSISFCHIPLSKRYFDQSRTISAVITWLF